ncbi:MAG: aspartate aminotransferase family protein, partial [Dermatophilaceae bacterium]
MGTSANLVNDHPRHLSFIPCAPTEAAAMFDLAGLPPEAGGVFVPGGTIGNLSALVTARTAG